MGEFNAVVPEGQGDVMRYSDVAHDLSSRLRSPDYFAREEVRIEQMDVSERIKDAQLRGLETMRTEAAEYSAELAKNGMTAEEIALIRTDMDNVIKQIEADPNGFDKRIKNGEYIGPAADHLKAYVEQYNDLGIGSENPIETRDRAKEVAFKKSGVEMTPVVDYGNGTFVEASDIGVSKFADTLTTEDINTLHTAGRLDGVEFESKEAGAEIIGATSTGGPGGKTSFVTYNPEIGREKTKGSFGVESTSLGNANATAAEILGVDEVKFDGGVVGNGIGVVKTRVEDPARKEEYDKAKAEDKKAGVGGRTYGELHTVYIVPQSTADGLSIGGRKDVDVTKLEGVESITREADGKLAFAEAAKLLKDTGMQQTSGDINPVETGVLKDPNINTGQAQPAPATELQPH